ncbi:MAG: hypothetical protein U0531_21075 [Dehalococcoidia bacterium]
MRIEDIAEGRPRGGGRRCRTWLPAAAAGAVAPTGALPAPGKNFSRFTAAAAARREQVKPVSPVAPLAPASRKCCRGVRRAVG